MDSSPARGDGGFLSRHPLEYLTRDTPSRNNDSGSQVPQTRKKPMNKKLVIIPCGAAKQEQAAPAAELYLGSMFKDALRTARTMTADENIRILSAKHGLLKLDQIVDPYEVKMGSKNAVTHADMAHQIAELGWLAEFNEIHALLPKDYFAAINGITRTPVINHYEGTKGIGYQKAVLASLRKAAA